MDTEVIFHITFLRHGESVGNAENRHQGQADFPLSARGMVQARALAECWVRDGRKYDHCLASPLLRARQTAEIVAGALNVPIEFLPEWMELNNGRLAGLSVDEAVLSVPYPDILTPYTRYGETGESRAELLLRAGRAVQGLMDRPAGRYLVVAHGGILNMVLYNVLNIALQGKDQGPRFMFDNTAYADMTYHPDRHRWALWAFNNENGAKGVQDG